MDYHESFTDIGQSSNGQRPLFQIRILVVDDDSTTLAVVSSMLQIWSYKVETAKNPLDALATLRMQKGLFDLVVTDLHMPFMNGFELKTQIDKEFSLPVIMMSADDQENIVLQSLHSGIALHITKPVKPDDLKDVWQFAIRAQKGKSVVIEEIGSNGTARIGDFPINKTLDDHDNQRRGVIDQSFGGGGSGISGALIIPRNPSNYYKRASNDRDIDHGNKLRGPKKPCNRKDPNHGKQEQRRKKKTKVVWTNSLHNRFLLSIRHLGYDKAVPKRILEFMNVPGLTRENVASHLQKYRLFLRRVAENGVLDATRVLADRFMRSSFAAGYPIQLMLQHAQQMYPHLYRKAQQRLRHSTDPPLPLPPPNANAAALPLSPPPPPPQTSSSSTSSSSRFRFASSRRNEASRSRFSLPPVGLSTLLMDNRSSPAANIVRQPMISRESIRGNRFAGQQQVVSDQARPGLFTTSNFSFNNTASGIYTLAVGDNLTVRPSSTSANHNNYQMTTTNSSGRANRVINGGGSALTQLNQRVLDNAGSRFDVAGGSSSGGSFGVGISVGTGFGYGQNSTTMGQSHVAGGFINDQAEIYRLPAPAAPVFRHNVINYQHYQHLQQQPPPALNANNNTGLLPPPPQYTNGLQNLGGGTGNGSYNDLGDVVNNNIFGQISDNNIIMSTNFGGCGYVDPFLNQTNQLQTLPISYELRVEDYASDLSDITYEEADNRVMINGVNASANQAVINIQNRPDLSVPGPPCSDQNAEQSFSQVQLQGNEQVLQQNPIINDFPSACYFPRADQISVQPQGNEQVVQNSGGNALPSESYFPNPINQIPLQPQGSEQPLYNPSGNALQSDGYYPALANQNTPLQLHGNDQQVVQNPAGGNALIPPPSDVYAPRIIDQTPPQVPGGAEVADPFQHVDLENLQCEVDWDEFMDCLLNDQEAPDLRE